MNEFLWAFQQNNSSGIPFDDSSGRAASRQASRDASEARRDVEELEEKIHHLEVINRAIWELLKDCTELTEEDLLNKVRDNDSKADKAGPRLCPHCDRPNSLQRRNCLYCGQEMRLDSAFDVI